MKKFDINSVSTPTLQSAILLKLQENPTDTLSITVNSILTNKYIPQVERVMIELIYRNGLRVSELLRIKGTDIMSNGSFIIRASKFSSNRIGFVINNADYLQNFRSFPGYVFSDYNRHFVYYLFKRLGIGAQIIGNRNKAVTHVLRHQAIENLQRATEDSAATAQAIGHRSKKSTEHYLNHKIVKS